MVVKKLSRMADNYFGVAADTKPTNAPIGSTFYETDTETIYSFDGAAWINQAGLVGGGGSSSLAITNFPATQAVSDGGGSLTVDGPLALNTYVITITGLQQRTVGTSAVSITATAMPASSRRARISVDGRSGEAVRVGNVTTLPTGSSGLKVLVGDDIDLSDPAMDASTLLEDLRFIRDGSNTADITLDVLYFS